MIFIWSGNWCSLPRFWGFLSGSVKFWYILEGSLFSTNHYEFSRGTQQNFIFILSVLVLWILSTTPQKWRFCEAARVLIKVCIQNRIALKAPDSDPVLKTLQKITVGQETFLSQLAEVLESNKKKANRDTFWFSRLYLVRLIKRFNFKSSKSSATLYNKKKLMESMAPALFFHYTMRRMFNIPGKKGRVLNADESLNYRWDPSTRTWTH